MFLIDVSNPITLVLMIVITLLLIFLGKELKKSYIPAIALFIYLALIILHVVQYMIGAPEFKIDYQPLLAKCLAIDFVMIFITFISYLWVDDIDSKFNKKKSIDKSLDWFWSKV